MAKLTINAAPTFKAKVGIPVAGGEVMEVEFTFKHRTRAQLHEFSTSTAERSDAESFMDLVCGWNFEEEFTADAVETMLQNYLGAARETIRVYIEQLTASKAKN